MLAKIPPELMDTQALPVGTFPTPVIRRGVQKGMNKGYGVKLAGEGWKKNLGATLITLGLLGGAGNIGTSTVEGVIGGSILAGLGGYLIHLEANQGGSGIFDKRFIESMRKKLKDMQYGGAMNKKTLQSIVSQNLSKPIHIKDIFGDDWKTKGKELINAIKAQRGSGIGKKIKQIAKKASDAALSKLKQFADGKTKFKPSDLLNYTAGAVGLAGAASAFIPGVDLISVPAATAASLGLKSAGTILKTTGRGVSLAGSGISEEVLYKLGDAALIASVLGISAAAAAKIYSKLKKKYESKGSGVKLAGTGEYPPGITFTKSGRIKRDRYSVYYGFYKKTKGGLTRDDFVLKGRKVISKKKSQMGKKLISNAITTV